MPSGIYKRKPFTKAHLMNMSLAMKGRMPKNILLLHSKENQAKAALTRIGNKNVFGKTWKWKVNDRKGEKHGNYIKDRTKLVTSEKKHLDTKYREWMFSVKKRDGWKCRIINADCKGRLESHHILNWKEYPELRYEINNGITLCHAHHPRGRKNEARLSPYFKKLVAEGK